MPGRPGYALAVGMQRTKFHALMRKHEISANDL